MSNNIRIGDVIIPISYDYMQYAVPEIRTEPGSFSGKKIGHLAIHETAITLERINIDGLVWWKIKTDNGRLGWALQAHIVRINWYERRNKSKRNDKDCRNLSRLRNRTRIRHIKC